MSFIRNCRTVALAVAFVFLFSNITQAFSVKDEIKLGEETSKEVFKDMPLSKNEKWQKDINNIGNKLVPFINRKEIKYHFYVVDAKDELNAFALPGGYVFFTERMWKIMTPDERAAILAHEMTHCDHRHAVNMMIKSQQMSYWMLPLMVLSAGTSAVLMNTVELGGVAIQERYSRKMEKDADENGIKLCAKAGFNPAGSVTSMEKLLHISSIENHYEVSDIFADHPDTKKRVEYLKADALALGAKESEFVLKTVDDPSRIGNITGKLQDMNMFSAKTNVRLTYGQKVAIKKMLWDDDKQVLMPKTVAIATVLTPGSLPILAFNNDKKYYLSDIMTGDGIYPLDDLQQSSSEEPTSQAATPTSSSQRK